MKRNITLLSFALMVSGLSMGQALQYQQAKRSANQKLQFRSEVIKPQPLSAMEKAGGDTLWINEFDDDAEWTAAGPGSEYNTNGWSIGNTISNSWAFNTGNMGTDGDFARFANNSPIDGTEVTDGPFTLTYNATLPDLTGVPVPHLEFEQYGAIFVERQEVQISMDNGVTWIPVSSNSDIQPLTAAGGSPYDRPMTRRFNIAPFLTGDLTAIQIRLFWDGAMNGPDMSYTSYGWFVDNLRIVEGYASDVKIGNVFNIVGTQEIQYTKIPSSQVNASTVVSFGAFVDNVGDGDLDVLMNVSNADGYDQNSSVVSVASLATDSLSILVADGYAISSTPGVYDFTYTMENANPTLGLVATLDDASLVGGATYADATGVTTTTNGSGTGLTVDITVDPSGAIVSVAINQAGEGYEVGDVITIDGGDGNGTIEVLTVEDITLDNTNDDATVFPFEVTSKIMAIDQYDGTAESFTGGFFGWAGGAADPGIGTYYEIFEDVELERVLVGIVALDAQSAAEYVGNSLFCSLYKLNPGSGELEFNAISITHEIQSNEFGRLVALQFEEPISLQAGDLIAPIAGFFSGADVPIAFAGKTIAGSVVGLADGGLIGLAPDDNGVTVDAPVVRLDFGTYLNIEESALATSDVNLYPNPASNNATIAFSLANESAVSVEVRDLAGKLIYSSNEGQLAAGSHELNLSTAAMAEGMYTYTLSSGDAQITKKFVVKK